MTASIDVDRLARVETISLAKGSHKPPNGDFEACAMELVSYIAGEPWSDHPECACPVLTAFVVAWNDSLPDDERTALLKPFLPHLVDTRGGKRLEARRATMAADWYIREFTPAWLRLAGLGKEADVLSGLPEILDFSKTPSIIGPLNAARDSASAAWSAARSAARSAAESEERGEERGGERGEERVASDKADASGVRLGPSGPHD